jgi:hypothetical protein
MIHWLLREQSYERSTKMEQEQSQSQSPEQVPAETAPPETVTEEKPTEHEAVTPGGTCKLCGWVWGDPVKGIAPHIVQFGATRQEPVPAQVAPVVAVKPSDPKACEAISMGATCPTCGWSASNPETAANPHPIL